MEETKLQYCNDGFVLLKDSIPKETVSKFGDDFEKEIFIFAQDNGVSRDEYLSVINKWSNCNNLVMTIMEHISMNLRHKVAEALGSNVAWPVGATLFRKSNEVSEASNISTHPHQDISYARFKGSQLFRATTWIPLKLINGDNLSFAKGSHRQGIRDIIDFLKPSGLSCITDIPICDKIFEDIQLGDCILFDSRVWHASTPMKPYPDKYLRLAIGIQWLTPGGLDGLKPGVYERIPDQDVPKQVNTEEINSEPFGIDNAGYFLKRVLITLFLRLGRGENETNQAVTNEKYSTLRLAEIFSDSKNNLCEGVLNESVFNIALIRQDLQRYVLFRHCARLHSGMSQGTKIFKPLFDHLIRFFCSSDGRILE